MSDENEVQPIPFTGQKPPDRPVRVIQFTQPNATVVIDVSKHGAERRSSDETLSP